MKVSEKLWKQFLKTSESLWETLKWKKKFILPGGSRQTGMYAPAQFLQTYWASFNPIELLEAAELLEADQRKHEGGQSKETSFSNWLSGVVPRRQCIYCLMCTTSSQYSLLQPKTSTKFDGILHNIWYRNGGVVGSACCWIDVKSRKIIGCGFDREFLKNM